MSLEQQIKEDIEDLEAQKVAYAKNIERLKRNLEIAEAELRALKRLLGEKP